MINAITTADTGFPVSGDIQSKTNSRIKMGINSFNTAHRHSRISSCEQSGWQIGVTRAMSACCGRCGIPECALVCDRVMPRSPRIPTQATGKRKPAVHLPGIIYKEPGNIPPQIFIDRIDLIEKTRCAEEEIGSVIPTTQTEEFRVAFGTEVLVKQGLLIGPLSTKINEV